MILKVFAIFKEFVYVNVLIIVSPLISFKLLNISNYRSKHNFFVIIKMQQ